MSPSPGFRNGSLPTVLLVHGAFADASIWAGVVSRLQFAGIDVVAPANPLRGLAIDARYIASVADEIDGPAILVGHSYGGAVITAVGSTLSNVLGLVYVAAFALEAGESVLDVSRRFPTACWRRLCVPPRFSTRTGTPRWSCTSIGTLSRACSQPIFQHRSRPPLPPPNARLRPRRSKRSHRQRPGSCCPAGTS